MDTTGRVAMVLALAACAAGCLERDTRHALYLTPGGGVRWAATEMNVRSDQTDAARKVDEEQAYLAAALEGGHAVAQALKALGPDGAVRTNIVRDQAPFHVVTEAWFTRADRMLARMFTEAGVPASAALTFEGHETRLRVRLDCSGGVDERETPVTRLLEDLDRVQFVLVEGRFGVVSGVEVTGPSRATLSKEWLEALSGACESKAAVEFALSWSTAPHRRP